MGMSHRGRLNVMVHTIGRAAAEIFAGFEDVDPRSVLGGGDVKYHVGATGEYVTRRRQRFVMHLVSNPSHLEAVDPVAMGRARAKQTRIGRMDARARSADLVHGDAAFAGQGIWAETLNYAGLRGLTPSAAPSTSSSTIFIGFTTSLQRIALHRASRPASAKRRPHSHLPRQRRRPRRRRPRRAASPPNTATSSQARRRHRSHRLSPSRPQRSRRSHHHPAAALPQNQEHPPLWEIYADDIGVRRRASGSAIKVREDRSSAEESWQQIKKNPADARASELLEPL